MKKIAAEQISLIQWVESELHKRKQFTSCCQRQLRNSEVFIGQVTNLPLNGPVVSKNLTKSCDKIYLVLLHVLNQVLLKICGNGAKFIRLMSIT